MSACSLYQALGFILYGPQQNANLSVRLLDYGDEKTFRELWLAGLATGSLGAGGGVINLIGGTQQILIIGNDPPDGVFDTSLPGLTGINFRSHFTATSWLAAWRLRFPEARAQIAVIDPRESRHAGEPAQTLQTLFSARDAQGRALIPLCMVLNSPALTDILRWLQEAAADAKAGRKVSDSTLELLKSTIWTALTSDREKHHALSNVLGAFLLRAQVGQGHPHSGEPWIQDFLLALFQALGIEADSQRIRLQEHGGAQRWITSRMQEAIGGAVLLDDMADIWEYFVRGALGFAGDAPFGKTGRTFKESLNVFGQHQFHKEIALLPERLRTFLKSGEPFLQASHLTGIASKAGDQFVLFLDLRLFPKLDGAQPGKEETEFLKAIAEAGVELLSSRRNVPWLTDDAAKAALRKECEEMCAGRMPATPETLLARVISLLDPTLPIVIFSSTHHTGLIDPFRGYGNIITRFRKPVLTGMTRNWPAIVRELHADFTAALEQAAGILRTRRNLARLVVGEPALVPVPAARPKRIIEIFIDESGDPFNQRDPGFAVGGVVFQHDSEQARNEFHRIINRAPTKWGVSDYAPDRIRAHEVDEKLPALACYPKRPASGGPEENAGFQLVKSALGEHSRIAAFALIDPDLLHFDRDNRLDSAILFERNSLDNIYHALLRLNLEMLLFQHPWIDLAKDTVFIHVATREQKVYDPNTRRIWQQAYGFNFNQRRLDTYTSLGSDDVFRLVTDLLHSRGWLDGRPDIVMARGVTLNDYEAVLADYATMTSQRNPPGADERNRLRSSINSQLCHPGRLDPNQIHYFADWIVRIALYRGTLPDAAKPWFELGYIQPVNDSFMALIDACRMPEGDRAISRLDGIKLTPLGVLRESSHAERYLRQIASGWPGKLSGTQLRRLGSKEQDEAMA